MDLMSGAMECLEWACYFVWLIFFRRSKQIRPVGSRR